MFSFIIFIILILILSFYVFITWNFDYWFKLGVPSPATRVFFGDLPNEFLHKKHISHDVGKIYK